MMEALARLVLALVKSEINTDKLVLVILSISVLLAIIAMGF